MQQTADGSPVAYPIVTIDGKDYAVKFSMLAQFVLDEAGVDTTQLRELLVKPGAGRVALYMKLFAAGVAHHFTDLHADIPSGAEWAARLGSDSVKFGEIVKAVNAAMGKAPSPAAAAPAQQKPAADQTSQQDGDPPKIQ